MSRKLLFTVMLALLGAALAAGLGKATGQQSAPTETKGMKASPPTAMDLGPEVEGVEGRQLRLRVVTLEPGGVIALHTHKGRPGVAYVLQGALTEHREAGWVKERKQGESWTEGKDVTHWAENKGSEPVVVLAVDVFKP